MTTETENPSAMLRWTRVFHVKPEHLELLRRATTWWCPIEFGAPCIDPKRPYGNGDVVKDIAEILGIEPDGDEDEPFSDDIVGDLTHLHKETKTVLQIALRVGYFKAGKYECDGYKRNWRPVDA